MDLARERQPRQDRRAKGVSYACERELTGNSTSWTHEHAAAADRSFPSTQNIFRETIDVPVGLLGGVERAPETQRKPGKRQTKVELQRNVGKCRQKGKRIWKLRKSDVASVRKPSAQKLTVIRTAKPNTENYASSNSLG
jgi:hypothetical protein